MGGSPQEFIIWKERNISWCVVQFVYNLLKQGSLPMSRMFILTVEYTVKPPIIRRTLVGIKIADHSDVVGASPVGAAPTTSSFST